MIETDRIYHMDCIDGMKLIADSRVDAIIADLPYGVLNRSNGVARWDNKIPLEPLWEQYRRITKPDSPIILFGQGPFSAWLILSQSRLGRYNLVWQKDRVTGHLNAKRMPRRQNEDILVLYQWQPVYHPQMIPCPPERRNHERCKTEGFTNRCYGTMKLSLVRIADDKYPTSVIFMQKEHKRGAFYHPTQKPVALMEYLIRPTPTRATSFWTTASVLERPPWRPSARDGTTSDSKPKRSIARLPSEGFGRN